MARGTADHFAGISLFIANLKKKSIQETYSIVLQLPEEQIPDLVPCAYQSYRVDTVSTDDLDHQNRPLFKFDEYTIIERDSGTDFPDPVVSPSIDERQFLSILQDECFLSEPTDINNNCIANPVAVASAAARDPFHADWPYWNRAT